MFFAFVSRLWLAVPILSLAGFGMMAQMASSNTVLQTIVDDDKRGRVMAFYSMAFIGTAPIGSLILGGLADRFGPASAFATGGAACILAAALFGRHLPRIREVVHPSTSGSGSCLKSLAAFRPRLIRSPLRRTSQPCELRLVFEV